MFLRTSQLGDSASVGGSGLRLMHGRDLLPTKTSLMMFIHLFGRSPSFSRTCSQVFTARLVNPFFGLILMQIFFHL